MKTSSQFHSLTPDEYAGLQAVETNAFRLLTGPGGWAEYYAGTVLLSATAKPDFWPLKSAALDLCQALKLSVGPVFGRLLAKTQSGQTAPEQLDGPPDAPTSFNVLESGLRFKIDLSAGYSIGLFIDQTQNRRYLQRLRPRRLLNCFSYTCAFSVAAAALGAETTSVDISKKALEWGRSNFELNGIEPAGHRFFADDVREALARLARRKERFDCIILDPPTFARSHKGKVFQVEDEMEALIRQALACLSSGGSLLASTNSRQINQGALLPMARSALATCQISASFHQEPPPPGFPPSAMPATLWLLAREGK
ncbi:MAG: class I SAM-dependent methyltransferase [Methylacidiphilales bacterium]|nr:class I SAM-dependent methyltransferase [Candidatus Methylacidiphilales bacterium]